MTTTDVEAALTAGGLHTKLITVKEWSAGRVVEASRRPNPTHRQMVDPLVRAFKDRQGRWVLSELGQWFYLVPNETDVPAAADMLRAMDRSMRASTEVIQRYTLVKLDPREFGADESEIDDE